MKQKLKPPLSPEESFTYFVKGAYSKALRFETNSEWDSIELNLNNCRLNSLFVFTPGQSCIYVWLVMHSRTVFSLATTSWTYHRKPPWTFLGDQRLRIEDWKFHCRNLRFEWIFAQHKLQKTFELVSTLETTPVSLLECSCEKVWSLEH